MTLERTHKPELVVRREPHKQKGQSGAIPVVDTRTETQKAQHQVKTKAKLEQDRVQIQNQAERASLQRVARGQLAEHTRVQALQGQALAAKQKTAVQRFAQTLARPQVFHSNFVKSAVQRQAFEQVKNSGIQTSQARAAYQAALMPEIVQRLANAEMTVQAQASRANQKPNDLSA